MDVSADYFSPAPATPATAVASAVATATMFTSIDTTLARFRAAAAIPVITSARFLASDRVVTTSWTVRDMQLNAKRTLYQTLFLDGATASVPAEDASLGLDAVFERGDGTWWRAVQRTTVTNGKGKKRWVEVWDNEGALIASVEVSDAHGDFYVDNQIGALAWSALGTQLVYVAERKELKRDAVDAFTYEPDFGEAYWEGEWAFDAANVLDLGAEVSPSKPTFILNDNKILLVGYLRAPKVWGLVYCPNRLARLYTLNLDGTDLTPLTPETDAASYPVLHASRMKAVYLSMPGGGPHNACSALHEIDFESGDMRVVVPVVEDPDVPGAFPGLFVDALTPAQTSYEDTIYATTAWYSWTKIVRIDLATGRVEKVNGREDRSYRVLDVSNRGILAVESALDQPPRLVRLSENGEWVAVKAFTPPAAVAKLLANVEVTVEEFAPRVQAIVVRQKEQREPSPLILLPHGGPHSVSANECGDVSAASTLGYVAHGHTVALVNYTGSTGFGNGSIYALVGKIGDLEVEDSHCVAKSLLARTDLNLDQENVYYLGGSHGGLIGAFLIGRYPGFYHAASIRNPALNLGTFSGTDIMDWSFAEAALLHDLRRPSLVTPDTYARMWTHSSSSVISGVETPTLMQLGKKDARVPNHQALEWIAWMRGNKPHVPVRTLVFDDSGHALDSMDAARYGFEATVRFFAEFHV
ncbi:hypothetical protein AMAG_06297 [Allomyces macrogynus ATCC 38327]|uniref:acylaminoacyl-peptidase n=1 Tax=Allomyces macrogynus (strain ATCC 38327) TaxID=578462 RepID=A0A0L0SG58_ALLM3|nr:hypothetical protein AMAG_06297 [Allomyces macrogynus ATCC 38327]|eukprot:KNE61476.1 hypothetical protein AMAG_06297 [Allomyces macrogynus ATCC 38327]